MPSLPEPHEPQTKQPTQAADPVSLTAPFRVTAFLAIWIASVISNIGTAMQGVGATWLMFAADSRPVMVAALQAASTLPMFIFGLPAGVFADIVDRRKLLLWSSAWMVLVSVAMCAAAYLGQLSPEGLIAGTFALGVGAAMTAPAFQAVVPDLVPSNLLTPAVTLNGIGNNVARTLGPALGGVVVGVAGAAATFGINALSTLVVLAALWSWRQTSRSSRLPPEHFLSALRASVRYVGSARGIRVVLLRATLFFAFASAFNALLPLVVNKQLGLGADGFGLLLGAVGVGSVGGALLLSKLRARLGIERLTAGGTALAGVTTIGLALSSNAWLATVAAALFGAGWIANLTLLNVGVQNTVAGWVRARMLAMYVMTFMGVSAAGSLLWGYLAQTWSLQASLLCAGVLQLVSLAVVWRLPFVDSATLDLRPAPFVDEQLVLDPEHDLEPVLVTVEYRVVEENAEQFSYALWGLEEARRRAGAMTWRHWRDQSDRSIHRESFAVESWTDYLRLTPRTTFVDQQLEAAVQALVMPGTTPHVRLFRGAGRYRGAAPAQPTQL
ncbi:hypothetical protein ABE85_01905 [Mitsuaria sp. 7]|nr:hypothetical protein ABE85_01905 [Mitsuaria sp. 7]